MPYGSNTRALELTPLRSVQKVCATKFRFILVRKTACQNPFCGDGLADVVAFDQGERGQGGVVIMLPDLLFFCLLELSVHLGRYAMPWELLFSLLFARSLCEAFLEHQGRMRLLSGPFSAYPLGDRRWR